MGTSLSGSRKAEGRYFASTVSPVGAPAHRTGHSASGNMQKKVQKLVQTGPVCFQCMLAACVLQRQHQPDFASLRQLRGKSLRYRKSRTTPFNSRCSFLPRLREPLTSLPLPSASSVESHREHSPWKRQCSAFAAAGGKHPDAANFLHREPKRCAP